MSRHMRLEEFLPGMEAAALFRHVVDGNDYFAAERVSAIRRLLSRLEAGPTPPVAVPELGAEDGHAAWAGVHDTMPNALIRTRAGRPPLPLAGIGHRLVLVRAGCTDPCRPRPRLLTSCR
jgi:hypothetical protein